MTSTKERFMTIVVPADFGFLSLGETNNFRGALNTNRRFEAVVFSTGTVSETVNISSAPRGNPSVQGADVDISLFRDSDGDRILNTEKDAQIGLPSSPSESFESINQRLSQGTYFVLATSTTSAFIPYDLKFSRQNTGQANPLTTPEIPLGQISEDLQKRDRISNTDTADNFAFTLDGSSSLNIDVSELGKKKKGDVNIRIVQDRNGNGEVDKNEVVVLGTSSSGGNIDTITGLNKAGDYILQVCQTQGKTKFAVDFDHSAA
jgi:uncharacterized protein (DUF2141 family)